MQNVTLVCVFSARIGYTMDDNSGFESASVLYSCRIFYRVVPLLTRFMAGADAFFASNRQTPLSNNFLIRQENHHEKTKLDY
jgi:hypothetical protein